MALYKGDDGYIYCSFDSSVKFDNWDAAYRWLADYGTLRVVRPKR